MVKNTYRCSSSMDPELGFQFTAICNSNSGESSASGLLGHLHSYVCITPHTVLCTHLHLIPHSCALATRHSTVCTCNSKHVFQKLNKFYDLYKNICVCVCLCAHACVRACACVIQVCKYRHVYAMTHVEVRGQPLVLVLLTLNLA